MRKLLLGLLMGYCMSSAISWAKAPDDFKLGTLDRGLADVGCTFVPHQAKQSSDPVFIVTVLGDQANWIKLEDRQIRLTKIEGKAQRIETFAGDGVRIVAKYGPFRYAGNDGEVEYKRALLEIKVGGRTKVIPAIGHCGYLEKGE